ncbi:MAG: CapA family protein, partial [Candidatus Cloacimonadaceae bacterium]|nr:CapA family protein [Candidatus Cloacimonadaceae bacterium]
YSTAPGSGYDKSNPFTGDDQDEDYLHRIDVPHMWDIEIRQYAIDAGADLVIVHHPHIIQALEMYNGKLIAHSLGNYVFDLDYPETMHSMILYADADLDGFSNFRVVPIYINDYIPVRANGALGIYTLDYLAQRSRERNTILWVDKNNVTALVIPNPEEVPEISSTSYFHQRMEPVSTFMNSTYPFKLPRSGSIASLDDISPIPEAEARFGREGIWFGNFEDEGCTLWQVPAFNTSDPFDGQRAAFLQPATGETLTASFKRRIKIYDNTKKYTLHGWVKTRNAGSCNITVRYFNTRTGWQISTEDVTTNISGTTDWTWYHKELTIPSNAWYYDIQIWVTNSGGTNVQAM